MPDAMPLVIGVFTCITDGRRDGTVFTMLFVSLFVNRLTEKLWVDFS